jgi:AcrR family transcriptional regulator
MPSASATRRYRMTRRAAAFAETRKAILDAAIEIGDPRAPLATVAAQAGVSERTLLRHFGSRDGFVAEMIREAIERGESERFAVPTGDISAAVANLIEHYEAYGDRVLRLLAEEGADDRVDEILAKGREAHHRWIAEKLGPLLGGCDAPTRRRRTAQLTAVCGVYTWKLLRRDCGLGREETERAVRELVDGVVDEGNRSRQPRQ